MDLGQTIRARRASLRMTQKALASAAGVHHNTIYKFEAGTGTLPSDVLEKVCESLGLKLSICVDPGATNTPDPAWEDAFRQMRGDVADLLVNHHKLKGLKFEHDKHDPQKLNFILEYKNKTILVFFDGKLWGIRPWINDPIRGGHWALHNHNEALMVTREALCPALVMILTPTGNS